jgi:serine/threonine-protein kinase
MTASPTNNPTVPGAPSPAAFGVVTDRLSLALADRYRIERHLGAGGMATVYLAQDLKHDRKVAIKVLKPELAAVLGAERFVVEIKTTAALQHPHILPLFDSGSADGFLYYVMPYVEGETLRDKLNRETQLGIDEAVRITREVADALDYAHRRGVIHRDIKPENILLHDGRPVVADFGIALAVSAAAGGRMTETGLSLGTPHYMSPEQATADKAITARSDIYSLGSVLYEMLAGDPPHTGSSAQQIIMKIIAEPAQAVTAYRKSVPANVAAAVAHALEKLPADRFESAKAFADALVSDAYRTHAAVYATAATAAAPGSRRLVTILGAACAGAIALGAWGWLRTPAVPQPLTTRFTIDLPPEIQFDNVFAPLTITHDGRTIVFRALVNNAPQLARRNVDGLTVTPIPGTEGAMHPVISPDDRWIAFTAGGEARRTALAGSPATRIGGAPGQGLNWATNDVMVESKTGGLFTIAVADAKERSFLAADTKRGEVALQWPKVLADGKTVLYVSWPASGLTGARIGVASLATGKAKVLDLPGTTPLGVADGHLFYVSTTGVLTAVPFDLRSLTPNGPPRALIENIDVNTNVGAARVALSDSGTLVYLTGGTSTKLVSIEPNGTSKVMLEHAAIAAPVWSPDGARIAVQTTSAQGKVDIGILDVASGAFARLTGDGNNLNPSWTADGRRVVFTSTIGGKPAIWWQPVDGTGNPEKLVDVDRDDAIGLVTPDGRFLVYQVGPGIAGELWMLELSGARTRRRLLSIPGGAASPAVSPDGKWLAYTGRDASGIPQVYVRAFSDSGATTPTQVSLDGANSPLWAPDGKTLYFTVRDQLYAATLAPGATMGVTSRRQVSVAPFIAAGATRRPPYSIAPDGKRFVTLARSAGESKIVVITNWLAELRRSEKGTR